MELYYVMTVLDRHKSDNIFNIYKEAGSHAILANLGYGTATSEHLLLYDLQQSEKAIITTVSTRSTLDQIIAQAKQKLYLDIPGNGIMLAVPMKSVSGGKTLAALTEGQEFGGKPTMNFDHELIVVILSEGYSDSVMDVARAAGAGGGTVLHAKGTGEEKTEKFYGVSLAKEKDMIYILATKDTKSAIMQAITQNCGQGTPSNAICFSLPVSEVVGLRNL